MGIKSKVSEQEVAQTMTRVRFNHKTGNPEIMPVDAMGNLQSSDDSVTAEELQNEHRRNKLGWFSSRDELIREFGPPTVQYFNFIKFTVVTNLIVFLVALIGFIPHVNNAGPKLYNGGIGFMQSTAISSIDLLFLSSVQPSSDTSWLWMIGVAVVVSFMAPFVYVWMATHWFKDTIKTQDMDYSINDLDKIERAKPVNKTYKIHRMVASYFVFCLCLGAPVIIMWALLNPALYAVLQAQYDSSIAKTVPGSWSEGMQLFLYMLVSGTVSIANIVFDTVVGMLTDFEGHEYWHQFRKHRLWKRVIFRVSNMMALLALRYWSDLPFYTCAAGRIAFQVLIFIILDLTVNNIIEVLYPTIMNWVNYLMKGRVVDEIGDEDKRPEFELSDEYFEIVYRQYIMYMGISVFPMISGITLVANLVEWATDKYRLFYHCRRPRSVVVGGRRHLFGALFISAFFALVTFPAGAVWWGAPLGPYMCWPCPQYAHYKPPGGECGASFDAVTCGNDISVETLRAQIDSLRKNPKGSAEHEAAKTFFEDNSGLFTSKRCACRPCLNVIGCGCHEPVHAFECETTPVPRMIRGDGCLPAQPECILNSQYQLMHCDKPRYDYSAAGAAGNGVPTEVDCGKHEDCVSDADPEAWCDTYCPTPREGDDTFKALSTCWDCPEVATSWLVNPGQARTKWESLPNDFCSKCVDQTSVCSGNSSST